jgi:hypothetical protein
VILGCNGDYQCSQGAATPGELRVLQLRARLSGKNWFPVVWQKLSNTVNRMGGNSRKHVPEPGEGFHAHPLTGCREASQDGGSLATPVTAEEDPVVAVMCDRT